MNNFTETFLNATQPIILHPNSDGVNIPSNTTSTSTENKDLLKKIYENTVEIKQTLKVLTSRIEELEEDNKKMHSRQLTEQNITQKLIKPNTGGIQILKTTLNSVEEFQKFEENVQKSPELCEKLEDEIFRQEGSDPSKFIRLIWRKIMSDNVASQFSWKGTHIKKSVDVMAVTNAFRGAFHRKFGNTGKEFNRASAKWFQTAKERLLKQPQT